MAVETQQILLNSALFALILDFDSLFRSTIFLLLISPVFLFRYCIQILYAGIGRLSSFSKLFYKSRIP